MRALPLLLKLAGGAGFTSSAHRAGPNEPSCLGLDIYLRCCFEFKSAYPRPHHYPYPVIGLILDFIVTFMPCLILCSLFLSRQSSALFLALALS